MKKGDKVYILVSDITNSEYAIVYTKQQLDLNDYEGNKIIPDFMDSGEHLYEFQIVRKVKLISKSSNIIQEVK